MDQPPAADLFPPRVRWFAPWSWFAHWKPWKRCTLLCFVLVAAYLESPVPGYWLVLTTMNPEVNRVFERFCGPALWLADHCPALADFYLAQWRLIDRE